MDNQILRLPIFTKTRKHRRTRKRCDFCHKGFKPLEMRYSYNRWSNQQGKDWFNYHRDCYRIVLLDAIMTLEKQYYNYANLKNKHM